MRDGKRLFLLRVGAAKWRLAKLLWMLLTRKFDFAIVFVGQGWGFIEKALMSMLLEAFGTKVLVFPRSGKVEEEIKRGKLMKYFALRMMACAELVFCQSTYWKTFYSSLYAGDQRNKFVVLENWLPDATSQQVKEWTELKEPIRILFMGRLDQNKGAGFIAPLIGEMTRSGINFHLVIAGGGPMEATLRHQLSGECQNGQVSISGWLYDKKKWDCFMRSDILVFMSKKEGYPNVVIEAQAAGVPVIAFDIPSIRSLIRSGETGWLVEYGDVKAMVRTIRSVIQDKSNYRAVRKAAMEKVRRVNDMSIAVRKLGKVILNNYA